MFVTLVEAKPDGGMDTAVQRLRDHLVPFLHGRPGVKGFGAFVAEDGASLLAFGLFDDKDAAAEVSGRLVEWLPGRSATGEAVFHDVSAPTEQEKDRHAPLFAVIRTYHGLPGQTETMHSLVSRHTLPAIEHAPGFRGFYSFRDAAEPDRAISITLFDTRDQAVAVHDAVLRIMRDRLGEMAYELPEAVMGGTRLLLRN